MRRLILDDKTNASDPGGIRLSHEKLKEFHPELYHFFGISKLTRKLSENQRRWLRRMEEHTMFGDSRAAVVISRDPLLVAAYTDELDYSAVLQWPRALVKRYDLTVGSRLLGLNVYAYGDLVSDLENGPAALHRYGNYHPLIAEFLSEDYERILKRKEEITEPEWTRAWEAAQEYLAKNHGNRRSGLPWKSSTPCSG